MSFLTDKRRILGPLDTEKLEFAIPDTVETTTGDGPFFLQSGITANANGSAYIESGNTRLQCCVYGPSPIRGSFNSIAELKVTVNFSAYIARDEDQEETMASYLYTAMLPSIMTENYPKSSILIVITVISLDTSLVGALALATSGCSAALVDSGVALRDMVTSGLSKQSIVSFMSSRDEIVSIWMEGNVDNVEETINDTRKSAAETRTALNILLANQIFPKVKERMERTEEAEAAQDERMSE